MQQKYNVFSTSEVTTLWHFIN